MLTLFALSVVLVAGEALAPGGARPDAGIVDAKGKTMSRDSNKAPAEVVRVRLTFGGKAAVVRLHANPASADLLGQLPLTLTLSDYASTEKVARLPKKLSTRGAPPGFDPSVGDVTYYAPWGNLAIFYKDFGYAEGLVSLGVVESGLQDLAALGGDATVVVEKIDERSPTKGP